jgi:hypothetical protein
LRSEGVEQFSERLFVRAIQELLRHRAFTGESLVCDSLVTHFTFERLFGHALHKSTHASNPSFPPIACSSLASRAPIQRLAAPELSAIANVLPIAEAANAGFTTNQHKH